MKENNTHCIDPNNNNKWSKSIYTKEQAKKHFKSLIDCSDCSDCSNCSNCKYCSNCSDFNRNPNRYTGNPIGSRRSQTTTYWLLGNIQVVCGCFRGNLSAFKEAVASKHKGNQHEQEYLQYIKIVETIISMEV